jgi:hypothetical protein
LTVVPWNQSSIRSEPCFLYAAQFLKGGNSVSLVAAGGSGTNEAKVFNRDANNRLVGTIAGLSRGVFTLDFAPQGDKMVVAGADAAIRIIDVYDYVPGEKGRERPVTPSIRCVRPPHLYKIATNPTPRCVAMPPCPERHRLRRPSVQRRRRGSFRFSETRKQNKTGR